MTERLAHGPEAHFSNFGRAGFSPMRLVLAEFVSHSWQNSRAVLGTGASSGARASSSASAGTSY